ncbi:MAG: flagellar motor switch protein FliG [Sphingomonadaceae bacterium]|nr:flagellar motor switch protein FliG [Sphingomonadaceae bacterium]
MSELQPIAASECAAVFLMLLDEADAAALLSRLGPDELQRVGTAMIRLGEVEPARIAEAIAGFVAEADNAALPAHGRAEQLGSLLNRAVGPVRGDSLMQRIMPDARPQSVEIARWLAPEVLAGLVEAEHPQVIAVLLLMLDAEAAGEVLAALPPSVQPAVVERVARLEKVTGEAVSLLDTVLSAQIGERFGAAALVVGGAREAANLINLAGGQVNRTVMPEIERRDSPLAKAIEAEMLTFEMLFELDPQSMGRLLRDVDNVQLVTALKGLEEQDRAPFFAAMSSRAADGVRDEIELLSKVKRKDVLAAQKAVIELARRLRDEGEIALGAGDGEFV